jgi:hypothetical protein
MAVHAQVRFSDAEHRQLKIACATEETSVADFIKQATLAMLTTKGYIVSEPTKEQDHEQAD